MNKSTSFTIITSLTLILGLAGAIALVRNSQDTRSSASFSNGSLALLPTGNIKKINEEFVIKVKSQNNTTANITAFQTVLCYDSKVVINKDSVKFNSGFTKAAVTDLTVNGKNCVGIAGYLEKSEGVSGVNLDLAEVTVKGIEVGSGEIMVEASKTKVAGVNPSGGDDNEIAVTVANATYTITENTVGPTNINPTPPDTTSKRIKAKFILSDVLLGQSDCMKEIPMSVIVLNNSVKTAITGVTARQTGEANSEGIAYYEAEIPMKDVSLPSSNVALFLKGPSHLQMKYGINNQDGLYKKAGGELSVNSNISEVNEFNFTKVPMLAGDAVGSSADVGSGQNGVIDAMDYSYVKAEANSDAINSSYKKSDLDGSCKVNGRDVSTLLKSLQEKQEQLY